MFKSFFEEEAQGFLFKACVALICASVFIFSLFQLGYAFQVWAMQFKDSFAIIGLAFMSTLLLSLIGLLFLFRKKKEKVVVQESEPEANLLSPLMNMNFHEKGAVFARGLIDGLVNGRG